MPQRGEGVRRLLPGSKELQEPSVGGNRSNPPPGMGGIFCLPSSEDNPAATAAHDRPGAEGASFLFTQDSLGEERRADAADDDSLTGTALFRSPPAAQGSGRRHGIATGQPTVDGARSAAGGTTGGALGDTTGGAAGARTSSVGNADGALAGTIGGFTEARAGDTGAADGALTGAAGGTNGARASTTDAADGVLTDTNG